MVQKRDLKHPVWDVYDLYRTTRLLVLYYSEKLNKYKVQNTTIEIVLAITTSSSAVAALWFWNTPIGENIWKYALIVSAFLAVIKPIINLTETIQKYEGALIGYRGLENDLKIITVQINQSRIYGETHRAKLMDALARQSELIKGTPEVKFEDKLYKKCQLQVEKDLPAEKFFVPEDK